MKGAGALRAEAASLVELASVTRLSQGERLRLGRRASEPPTPSAPNI